MKYCQVFDEKVTKNNVSIEFGIMIRPIIERLKDRIWKEKTGHFLVWRACPIKLTNICLFHLFQMVSITPKKCRLIAMIYFVSTHALKVSPLVSGS